MTNITDSAERVEVTQADCDAAADLIETYWSGSDPHMMKLAARHRAGHTQGTFPYAFARHRLASRSPDVGGVREAIAKIVADRCREGQFMCRRSLDKSCYEVIEITDHDCVPAEGYPVVETYPTFSQAGPRADALSDEYTADAILALLPQGDGWRPNPCAEIFDHKWLDPECVVNGCKSLLPRRLADEIAEMPLPDDPHTAAWQLGFCRAKRMAAEHIRAALSYLPSPPTPAEER